jgi:4-hydroxybenzoate polyprenyltransferase
MVRLRIYECLQLLAPGIVGIVCCHSARALLDPVMLPYLAAYLLHLFFTYTYNDYAELSLDRANPRKASVSESSHKALGRFTAACFVGCLAAMAMLPAAEIALFAIFQVAGVLYSHPRLHWKARTPGSEALHALTGGGYFLSGCWLHGVEWTGTALWGSLAFAAIYTSGSCMGQLRDRVADEGVGLRTLAVVAGPRTTLWLGLCLGCWRMDTEFEPVATKPRQYGLL